MHQQLRLRRQRLEPRLWRWRLLRMLLRLRRRPPPRLPDDGPGLLIAARADAVLQVRMMAAQAIATPWPTMPTALRRGCCSPAFSHAMTVVLSACYDLLWFQPFILTDL